MRALWSRVDDYYDARLIITLRWLMFHLTHDRRLR